MVARCGEKKKEDDGERIVYTYTIGSVILAVYIILCAVVYMYISEVNVNSIAFERPNINLHLQRLFQ